MQTLPTGAFQIKFNYERNLIVCPSERVDWTRRDKEEQIKKPSVIRKATNHNKTKSLAIESTSLGCDRKVIARMVKGQKVEYAFEQLC
jgi:predicted metal-binding protein